MRVLQQETTSPQRHKRDLRVAEIVIIATLAGEERATSPAQRGGVEELEAFWVTNKAPIPIPSLRPYPGLLESGGVHTESAVVLTGEPQLAAPHILVDDWLFVGH
ncbi:unnamed protein product [Calypogeia fissa]